MAVCLACGTDNRDKAKFCRGCARALTSAPEAPPADLRAPGPVQTCPKCQVANPLAATVCTACRTSLVPDLASSAAALHKAPAGRGVPMSMVLGSLLLVVAAGWWFAQRDASSSRMPVHGAVPAASSEAPPPSTNSPVPLVGSTATAVLSTAVPAKSAQPTAAKKAQRASEQRRQAALEKKRQQATRELAAAQEREQAARAAEQQRAERAAQQQAAQDAAARARAVKASAPPLAPVKTVQQTCAGSSNFLAREVCRFQSCRDTAFANDPVCIRHREVEAANRRAATN